MIGGIDRPDLSKAEQSRGSRTAEQETPPLAIQVVPFFFLAFPSFLLVGQHVTWTVDSNGESSREVDWVCIKKILYSSLCGFRYFICCQGKGAPSLEFGNVFSTTVAAFGGK